MCSEEGAVRRGGIYPKYYRGAGSQPRGRCGSLVGHLDEVRKRIEKIQEVIRRNTCYPSVLVRMSTIGTTLGDFGGILLTGRVQAYITSSVQSKGSRAVSRLIAALRGLVQWGV